jgi:hypothetical protein
MTDGKPGQVFVNGKWVDPVQVRQQREQEEVRAMKFTGGDNKHIHEGVPLNSGDVVMLNEVQQKAFSDRFEPTELSADEKKELKRGKEPVQESGPAGGTVSPGSADREAGGMPPGPTTTKTTTVKSEKV